MPIKRLPNRKQPLSNPPHAEDQRLLYLFRRPRGVRVAVLLAAWQCHPQGFHQRRRLVHPGTPDRRVQKSDLRRRPVQQPAHRARHHHDDHHHRPAAGLAEQPLGLPWQKNPLGHGAGADDPATLRRRHRLPANARTVGGDQHPVRTGKGLAGGRALLRRGSAAIACAVPDHVPQCRRRAGQRRPRHERGGREHGLPRLRQVPPHHPGRSPNSAPR